MHPISTDTTAIRTALWDLTAQIPEHSGTYRPKGKVGKELVCFLCAFPPSLTMEIYCTVGCSFIFALCLLFPWFLPALLSVSISTLFQGVHFQNCFCAFFSGHQSTTVSPFSPPSFPFSLPSCLSWDRSSGLVAICCLFFFFLWGWDQMASNRSSWSPWLPGWQSTWERHVLQPGAVRPFLRGRKKIKPLPSYLHIYIFLKCSGTQTLFMFYIAT